MKKLLLSVFSALLAPLLLSNSIHAAEAEANDEIVIACEQEAEGMADPMAYIQQCIEDRMAAMQGQGQMESEKAE